MFKTKKLAYLSLILLGSVFTGCSNKKESEENLNNQQIYSESIQSGIKVKYMNSKTNDDGSETKTYGYAIVPSYATSQDITISLAFQSDKSSCEEYVTGEVYNEYKVFELTCLQPFNKKIEVTLQSVRYPDKTCIMTLDYIKKVKQYELKDTQDYWGSEGPTAELPKQKKQMCFMGPVVGKKTPRLPFDPTTWNVEYFHGYLGSSKYKSTFNALDAVYVDYSIFSKDREFNHKYRVNSFSIDEQSIESKYNTPELSSLLCNAIIDGKYPSLQEFFDVNKNVDGWQKFLVDSTTVHRLCTCTIGLSIYSEEMPEVNCDFNDISFVFNLDDGDTYNTVATPLEGIVTVDENLEF